MPTLQVTPDALGLLQNVADTLAKSRKMVIITGAGISTNSGIPDFRSENGLYSLIQDQFERAEANATANVKKDPENDCGNTTSPSHPRAHRPALAVNAVNTATTTSCDLSERPLKRRRTSGPDNATSSTLLFPSPSSTPGQPTQPIIQGTPSVDICPDPVPDPRDSIQERIVVMTPVDSSRRVTRSQATVLRPTIPRHLTQHSVDSSTSHDSVFSDNLPSCESPQTDTSAFADSGQINCHTWTSTPRRPTTHLTTSSSPLSSPPPDLFDPYENANSSTDNSSHEDSDCSDTSESDDTQQSLDFFSSQVSNSNLRNMKGRDLFDCNIWADPLKTSVFYRFATSLRQRVKEVEPTITHRFIAQMRDVGKLARVYTQNIDEIEKKIGLSTDLKHGFGNKKRKCIKQQLLEPPEKGEATQFPDEAHATGTIAAVQASPKTEDSASTPSKPHPTLSSDKGVECVFLHGSLHSLRCFVCGKLCDWDEDGRESCTLSGEQPECPHCAGATAARQEKGKRALGIGKLRPDIVLYGEEHPQSDLISPIVQHDLAAGPDLLLVLGTSLRVHGLKVMVKEFARAVHKKGGKVVFINFTKPSESAWGDVLDYWIEWDCDAWVEDLRTRKPLLWLSPNERLEMDRQRRETLAEKKKEALKKRESIDGKKRDIPQDKKQHLPEQSKTRLPPKNPVAMRNDYQCGAYIVWDIFQTLAKIGDRPFDNLGSTPSTSILGSPSLPDSLCSSGVSCHCEPSATSHSRPCVRKRNRRPLPRKAPSQGQGLHYQPRFDDTSSIPNGPLNSSRLASSVLVGVAVGDPKAQQQSTMSSHAEKPPDTKRRTGKSALITPTTNVEIDHRMKPVNKNKRHGKQNSKNQYLQAARELARSRKTPTPGFSALASRLPAMLPASEPHDPHPSHILSPVHFVEQESVDNSRRHSSLFQPRLLPPLPGLQYHKPPKTGPLGDNWEESPPPTVWPMAPLGDQWVPPTLPLMEIDPLVGPRSPLAKNRSGLSNPHFYTWHHSTQPIYTDSLIGISRQAIMHKPQWYVESNDDNTPSPSDQLRMEAANQLWQLRERA
ncbi:DHS-like NAD/FAD-binding domain-containing protein [Xylaria sp. FL1777]|nr:DHS-like NAD/FAD-binding domain-containing protein [Xylaria sp. FL1777]